jgi:hypothetical protein
LRGSPVSQSNTRRRQRPNIKLALNPAGPPPATITSNILTPLQDGDQQSMWSNGQAGLGQLKNLTVYARPGTDEQGAPSRHSDIPSVGDAFVLRLCHKRL